MTGYGGGMRALMVDSERTWRGGEGQLRLLIKGLLDEGVEVDLAAPRGSEIEKRTREFNIPFHAVDIGGGMDMVSAWRLRSVIRRGHYDVVHSHASHAHSVTFMACAALPGDARPFQVVSRRVDFAVATNRLSGLKYRRGADVYLAISNGVRDVLIESGIDAGKIRLVPSGIELEKFDRVRDNGYVKKELGIGEDTLVVGNVAALAPHKSQRDFVGAAKILAGEFPNALFLIVGEGRLRGDLENRISDAGLGGRVVLTGFREDPLEILSTFSCFVLSSYLEGLGTSVMDAQAMGVPVVATRTGGVPDIVEDGVTGLLVPPRDPEALAGAIARLLRDPDLGQQLAKTALVQSRGYDYRQTVYKTLDAYRELVSSPGGGPTGRGRWNPLSSRNVIAATAVAIALSISAAQAPSSQEATEAVPDTVRFVYYDSLYADELPDSNDVSLMPEFVGFGEGEKLVFAVQYGIVSAGEASLEIRNIATIDSAACYRVVSNARTNDVFSAFFKVRDRFESYIDTTHLYSLRYEKHIREGKFKRDEVVEFDQRRHMAIYTDHEVPIAPRTQDVLSALYYARTLPLEVGQSISVANHTDGKNYPLVIKVLGKETVTVDAGTFDCLVVEPVLRGPAIFTQKGRLTVWMTDDKYKMPVLMKSKVVIGSVAAVLKEYKRSDKFER